MALYTCKSHIIIIIIISDWRFNLPSKSLYDYETADTTTYFD